jgi:hypothetical protein
MKKITLSLGLLAMTIGNAQDIKIQNERRLFNQVLKKWTIFSRQTLSHSVSQEYGNGSLGCFRDSEGTDLKSWR